MKWPRLAMPLSGRLWSRLALAAVVAVTITAGAVMLRHRDVAVDAVQSHPYFRVERIQVRGAGALVGEGELQRWLGIRVGQSLWSADAGWLRLRALDHPMIEAASVRRVFPATLEIRVRERRPAAITVLGDLYYLDRRGRSFGPLAVHHDRDYPVFTGLDNGDGQRRWATRRALHLLRRGLSTDSRIEISEMHLDPIEGLVLYPDRPRVPVFLGWKGWETRLRQAERVLVDALDSTRRLVRVDLRFRDQVVVELLTPERLPVEVGRGEKVSA